MASDSTAVRFQLCRASLTSPAVSAAATPEVRLPFMAVHIREHCRSLPSPGCPAMSCQESLIEAQQCLRCILETLSSGEYF